MSRTIKILLAANLLAIATLVFSYPHLMIGPGKLIPAHQNLSTDCMSCHKPFRGASSERCENCHIPADIGLLLTTGQPVTKPRTSTPFHQKLISQDCVACHSDHSGVQRFRKEGQFKHTLLQLGAREQCQECHKAPVDALHREITKDCARCHSSDGWRPATFEHSKFFVLDRDHNTSCVTCHVKNDFNNYTCFGCHEHTPANIRNEHEEEGIRNFNNCVECHRSADEDDIRGGNGGRKGEHDD